MRLLQRYDIIVDPFGISSLLHAIDRFFSQIVKDVGGNSIDFGLGDSIGNSAEPEAFIENQLDAFLSTVVDTSRQRRPIVVQDVKLRSAIPKVDVNDLERWSDSIEIRSCLVSAVATRPVDYAVTEKGSSLMQIEHINGITLWCRTNQNTKNASEYLFKLQKYLHEFLSNVPNFIFMFHYSSANRYALPLSCANLSYAQQHSVIKQLPVLEPKIFGVIGTWHYTERKIGFDLQIEQSSDVIVREASPLDLVDYRTVTKFSYIPYYHEVVLALLGVFDDDDESAASDRYVLGALADDEREYETCCRVKAIGTHIDVEKLRRSPFSFRDDSGMFRLLPIVHFAAVSFHDYDNRYLSGVGIIRWMDDIEAKKIGILRMCVLRQLSTSAV